MDRATFCNITRKYTSSVGLDTLSLFPRGVRPVETEHAQIATDDIYLVFLFSLFSLLCSYCVFLLFCFSLFCFFYFS